jgi:hypothetical protein
VTTIICTGDTLTIENDERKANVTVERALTLATDCDLIESITYAWQHKGEKVVVPSITKARGLKPRAAQKHFVQ